MELGSVEEWRGFFGQINRGLGLSAVCRLDRSSDHSLVVLSAMEISTRRKVRTRKRLCGKEYRVNRGDTAPLIEAGTIY